MQVGLYDLMNGSKYTQTVSESAWKHVSPRTTENMPYTLRLAQMSHNHTRNLIRPTECTVLVTKQVRRNFDLLKHNIFKARFHDGRNIFSVLWRTDE